MNKLLLILVSLACLAKPDFVLAFDYDPLLMRAQASIFPKIILLDKDLDNKLKGNQVIIEILHTSQEKDIATTIKSLIEKQYKSNLGEKKLVINLNEFGSFDTNNTVTAYFILKGTSKSHNEITLHAAGNHRLVFSYDYKDFDNNALVSILMKEKTYIYLNKSAIHNYDIKFLPLFYKIVKVIE